MIMYFDKPHDAKLQPFTQFKILKTKQILKMSFVFFKFSNI